MVAGQARGRITAMAIDQSKLGNITARLMETLEAEYGEDAELGAIMLIVAVGHQDGTKTSVHYDVSDGLPEHEGIGLLEYVQNAIAFPRK